MPFPSAIAEGPSAVFYAVTPGASALPNGRCRALYIGVAGDVSVKNRAGDTVLFKAMAVGEHPISTDTVLSAGTTATDIVALY